MPQADELMLPKDDSGFELAAGRDTLEDYGVQVYHGEKNFACTD